MIETGYEGIGKPEALTGNLASFWSRKIDYKTYEKTIVLDNRWYVYNGELPEVLGGNNDNIYFIAVVN